MKVSSWQRNLAALWLAQTLTMVAFSFILPFIPLYVHSMGVYSEAEAATWAAIVAAAAAIAMAFTQPIWGVLADRHGRRPMVIRSMLGACVTTVAMGLATTPEQLTVARFAQGAVSGTVVAATALVATSTPRDKVGFALGVLQMGFFVGTSIGPLIGGIVADTLGYDMAMFAAAAMMAVGTVIVTVFVQEDFSKPPVNAPKSNVFVESRELMAIGIFPILVGLCFMIHFGGVIVSPILSLFIEHLEGIGRAATLSGVVLAGMGAASAISALVLGRVSDRIGHTTILPICLIGAAVTYFPQAYVQDVWQLLGLRVLLGVFLGGLMPSVNALVTIIVPHARRGAAFGLTAMAAAMANFAGPLSGAAIVAAWDMRTVFLVTGALYVASYLWVFVGFRRGKVTPARPAPTSPRNTGGRFGQPPLVPERVEDHDQPSR